MQLYSCRYVKKKLIHTFSKGICVKMATTSSIGIWNRHSDITFCTHAKGRRSGKWASICCCILLTSAEIIHTFFLWFGFLFIKKINVSQSKYLSKWNNFRNDNRYMFIYIMGILCTVKWITEKKLVLKKLVRMFLDVC